MTIREILHIDIRAHFDYSEAGCFQAQKNSFLRRAKKELIMRAFQNGIFDGDNSNSHYHIRFKKVPHNEQDMERAIDELTEYFMMDQCGRYYANNKAHREYEKLRPFNLEMIIEVNDDN